MNILNFIYGCNFTINRSAYTKLKIYLPFKIRDNTEFKKLFDYSAYNFLVSLYQIFRLIYYLEFLLV